MVLRQDEDVEEVRGQTGNGRLHHKTTPEHGDAPPHQTDQAAGRPAAPTSNTPSNDGPQLIPEPLQPPKRRVELATVDLSSVPESTPVDLLEVRELKGTGATFTANLEAALTFRGLVYQPDGDFETFYHLVGSSLASDRRIAPRLRAIVFVPAFAWSTVEIVLMPVKATRFGAAIIHSLQSLQSRFLQVKTYVEWCRVKKRHVVNWLPMTSDERELISKVNWPTKEQIVDALQLTAFDDLDELAAANADIRTVLAAREVT